jgi:cytochrome c556
MMRRLTLAAALIAAVAGVASANPAVIKERQDILKSWGPASRAPGLMLRGEQAFAIEPVQAALRAFADGSSKLPALFPPDSQTGGDTRALPVIWQRKDEFNAIFAKLQADSRAALTAITNEATFRTEMPKVLANCGACHNTFRTRQ